MEVVARQVELAQVLVANYDPFGKARDGAITPVILRQYMDKRGTTSKTRANRERSFLGILWGWAFERGHLKTRNPARDVKPFREHARERYVTDAAYPLSTAAPRPAWVSPWK